jgi:hypothetical protein
MRWTILAASLSFAAGFGLRWAAYGGPADPPDVGACREALAAQVDATRTWPAPFPPDPAVQPAAVLAELGGYAAACPWVLVVRVDCSEYPCLVVQDGLCPPQMAAGWSWMLPESPSGAEPEAPSVYGLARYDADRTAQLRVPAGAAQRAARDRLAERIAATRDARAPRSEVPRSGDGSHERSQELRWLVDATLESGQFREHPQVEAELRGWSEALGEGRRSRRPPPLHLRSSHADGRFE